MGSGLPPASVLLSEGRATTGVVSVWVAYADTWDHGDAQTRLLLRTMSGVGGAAVAQVCVKIHGPPCHRGACCSQSHADLSVLCCYLMPW